MYDTICGWQIFGKSGSMIQYVGYNMYYRIVSLELKRNLTAGSEIDFFYQIAGLLYTPGEKRNQRNIKGTEWAVMTL